MSDSDNIEGKNQIIKVGSFSFLQKVQILAFCISYSSNYKETWHTRRIYNPYEKFISYDISTSWNSKYYMVKEIFKIQVLVTNYLQINSELLCSRPTVSDHITIREIPKVCL